MPVWRSECAESRSHSVIPAAWARRRTSSHSWLSLAVVARFRVGGRLVRGPVKTAAGVRTLPLVPLTRAALLAQRGKQGEQRAVAGQDWTETDYVFTTRSSRPLEPRNLSRSFDRIVASAGLPRIVFHDLRRTAATLLKSLGVPARDAQMILGHAHVSITLGIYSEVFDTEIAVALTRVNNTLDQNDHDNVVGDRAAGEASAEDR